MTTGTYLSKINTVTFSYGYFQKKTKKTCILVKKKTHAGKSFECNLKLNQTTESDKNCLTAVYTYKIASDFGAYILLLEEQVSGTHSGRQWRSS